MDLNRLMELFVSRSPSEILSPRCQLFDRLPVGLKIHDLVLRIMDEIEVKQKGE